MYKFDAVLICRTIRRKVCVFRSERATGYGSTCVYGYTIINLSFNTAFRPAGPLQSYLTSYRLTLEDANRTKGGVVYVLVYQYITIRTATISDYLKAIVT